MKSGFQPNKSGLEQSWKSLESPAFTTTWFTNSFLSSLKSKLYDGLLLRDFFLFS